MTNIIQLLPDSIANQIAAGEVIQRPASVVKELLENAVDSGATRIDLVVKDAGKTLIQVSDNGCGMNDSDLRMSIERHATSKIRSAHDLFEIRTMGFRGEALASIASIAQMDIRTGQAGADCGSKLEVHASEVMAQEPIAPIEGTTIRVKNLFYNIPARRKFLKSDKIEYRHIIDEFERVALPNHEIYFTLTHNDQEVFHLPNGSLRQRIIGIFGKNYNHKLVPVEQETSLVNIKGYVVRPEDCRKTRGEQFFFSNGRFIKSHSLNHAIAQAMEDLLPRGYYPGYFLMLDIDPSTIDVNIHPTKTEIKFEDERAIYAILNSSVKQALGQYAIKPSLDFEQETSFNVPDIKPGQPLKMPEVKVNTSYNPFEVEKQLASKPKGNGTIKADNWEELYRQSEPVMFQKAVEQLDLDEAFDDETTPASEQHEYPVFQLHKKYILTHIKSGFMLVHQSRAHERVIYEQVLDAFERQEGSSQQQLFPETIDFNANDANIVREIIKDLNLIGFQLSAFGSNSFIVQGLPSFCSDQNPKVLLEGVLESFKNHNQAVENDHQEYVARALARKSAVRSGKVLSEKEMSNLIDELFACTNPQTTPGGKPIIITLTIDELDKRFN